MLADLLVDGADLVAGDDLLAEFLGVARRGLQAIWAMRPLISASVTLTSSSSAALSRMKNSLSSRAADVGGRRPQLGDLFLDLLRIRRRGT